MATYKFIEIVLKDHDIDQIITAAFVKIPRYQSGKDSKQRQRKCSSGSRTVPAILRRETFGCYQLPSRTV